MTKVDLDKEKLEKFLREAEKAHSEYEKELDQPDKDWPTWYAEYIYNKINN